MRAVQHLKQKDYAGEVAALHAYVRDQVRYVRDIDGVETLQTPEQTLNLGQGDCDDKSTLLAAMLASLGHKARFEAVGFQPGRYSHVFVSAKLRDKWVPLETTLPVPMGWAPPRIAERTALEL